MTPCITIECCAEEKKTEKSSPHWERKEKTAVLFMIVVFDWARAFLSLLRGQVATCLSKGDFPAYLGICYRKKEEESNDFPNSVRKKNQFVRAGAEKQSTEWVPLRKQVRRAAIPFEVTGFDVAPSSGHEPDEFTNSFQQTRDFGYLTPTRAHRGRQDSAPSYRNKTEAELRNSFSGTAISLTFETDSTQPEGTDSLRSETLEMP
ncbi:hypothetical protein L1987_87155 [Smallanthus sonchifolius]|nr:hypothetical protein L1987_89826 [Smallanthus sonchifolius]KAI3664506.1 hypothetical protein L1987_89734 [Smallanthus sonchifolius]KAI3664574.1 hypothetical protein L1987_89664 [Smallanthus sonchifolius]KAI3664636.1 hypothetical protein L1987_89602 [Smallanthus sonchifolius]KAI3664655.1 hypothetical protein L1987_89574 [Smallanthus sonchifolius]